MSRNIKLYLEDIVSSCTKILYYTQSMTFEEFVTDERTFDAVIFNLYSITLICPNDFYLQRVFNFLKKTKCSQQLLFLLLNSL